MNKKYLLLSFLFLAGLSLHNFSDHYSHVENDQTLECQACEENQEIDISSVNEKTSDTNISLETNLNSRFVSFDKKSYLSRAPPLN